MGSDVSVGGLGYAADNIRTNNVLPGWIDSLPATQERRDHVSMKRYGVRQNIRIDGRITRTV